MAPIPFETNPFGGVLPDPKALPADRAAFKPQLDQALASWGGEGHKVVWLEVPIDKAELIAVAVDAGFEFHHADTTYLMLTHRLVEKAFIPPHATHYIGAGGVVINSRRQLLVVSEQYHRAAKRPPRYKLPGGALHPGEHLAAAVVREVFEETGIEAVFDAVVCLRHWHGYRFGKSDIYFVCRLHPKSEAITIQEEEIAECRWMPVEDYLSAENVSTFNKSIVRAAIESSGVSLAEMADYGDPSRYEFFFPTRLQADPGEPAGGS